MLTRCVVMVDAAYVRTAAARQLTEAAGGRVVVSDIGHLLDDLRAMAEDVTGEDLLRVYWYESDGATQADTEPLATQPYLTVRTVATDEPLGASTGSLARDLTTLLTQLACGDLVICTADPSLAPLFALAQAHCRHVHWLQAGDIDHVATATLWATSDTRQYLSHTVLTRTFRIAAPGERRPAPATPSTSVPRESNAPSLGDQEGPPARPARPARRGSASTDNGEPPPQHRSSARRATHAPASLASSAPRSEGDAWDEDPFARPRRAPTVSATRAPRTATVESASSPETPAHRRPREALQALSVDGDDVAVLHRVAAQVAHELGPHDIDAVRAWERGVPSDVDRQLLGASYSALGRRLVQTEKVLLRRLFIAACEGQASAT